MKKPTESLQGFSRRLSAAYETILEAQTMLDMLRDANSETRVAHMCKIILERLGIASQMVEDVARKLDCLDPE